MPDRFVHTVRVRPQDCDRQGVVGHPRYLNYFEAALIELWREAVGPFGETVGLGVDLAVAEVNVRYFAAARFDDEIDIAVTVREIDDRSLLVRFDARVSGGLAARGEVRYAPIGVATGARHPLPEPVARALGEYREQ